MNKKAVQLFQFILFVLIAYLPFQVALNLTSSIDLMSGRLFILGFALLWLIKEWSNNQLLFREIFKERVSVFLLVFFLLSALSILVAENQIWGLRKLLVFVSVFPLFWLVGFLIKNNEDEGKLKAIVLGGAVVSACLALVQFFSQFIFEQAVVIGFLSNHILPLFSGAQFGSLVALNPSWQVEIGGQAFLRAIGLFPDPHMLSFYLGLASPFALAGAFFSKKYRLAFGVVFALLFLVLLLTFSRGGYLGLIAFLFIFGLCSKKLFGYKEKKLFIASLLLSAVLLFFIGWPVITRLFSSFDLAEGSNAGRLAIWQDSWQVIKKSPVLGVGLGNYSLAVSLGQDYRNSITSHNLYLDILAEMGLLGLFAWILLIGAGAAAAIKKLKYAPATGLGALGALVYFSVHSFFESAIFNPTVLAFLMLVLALAITKEENIIKQY